MHNIYLCIIPKGTFIGIFIEGSMNVDNNCILFLSIFSSFYLHFIYISHYYYSKYMLLFLYEF